jgi:precorrin-3B synthase
MQTGDGLLVRLASLGATIGLDAAAGLCAAARRHGNGIIEITARGSIQIRGLTPASAPDFAEAMAALDIAAGDDVSILVDPLAGLVPEPTNAAGELAAALHQRLGAVSLAAKLGPKVSVVIDGGSLLHLDAVRADIRLHADGAEWQVALGGDATNAAAIGAVSAANAVEAVLRLLETIARHGAQARASALISEQSSDAFRAAIADLLIGAQCGRDSAANSSPPPCGEGLGVGVVRCGTAGQYGTTPLPTSPPREVGSTRLRHLKVSKSDKSDFDWGRESSAAPTRLNLPPRPVADPIGTHPLRDGVALGIGLAFGHTDGNALERLTEAAKGADARGLRTAAGRALLVIGVAADTAPELAAAAESLGFITRRDDPRRQLVACAGAPICASAEIPARRLGPRISAAAPALLDGSLRVHVSGCRKGCAHPAAATLTIVGGQDGCGLVIGGSARDPASISMATAALSKNFGRLAQEVAPGEKAADALARLGPARIAAILGATHRG